jgi:hypothetical protein
MGVGVGPKVSVDTGMSLMDAAVALKRAGFGGRALLVITASSFPTYNPSTYRADWIAQYKKMCALFSYLSGDTKGLSTIITLPPNPMKSGCMHGMFAFPYEIASKIRYVQIYDRNTNCLDTDTFVKDVKRMISNPNVVIMPALRNTTNVRMPIGGMSWLVEGGHGYSLLGWNDKIGTGWGNIMQLLDTEYLHRLRYANAPVMPITSDLQRLYPSAFWRYYGLLGLGPHLPFLSEDTADVWAQAHNVVGLGRTPDYALSLSRA